MKYYDEYDDYYGEGGHKLHLKNRKKKYKGKGHQSKHQCSDWDHLEEDNTNMYEEDKKTFSLSSKPSYQYTNNSFSPTLVPQGQAKFIPGPNSHTIKGNIIDFDRVASIEKIESIHDGKTTYGIKFIFVGKKGLYRTAWFNVNNRERDHVYNTEFAFWNKVKNDPNSNTDA